MCVAIAGALGGTPRRADITTRRPFGTHSRSSGSPLMFAAMRSRRDQRTAETYHKDFPCRPLGKFRNKLAAKMCGAFVAQPCTFAPMCEMRHQRKYHRPLAPDLRAELQLKYTTRRTHESGAGREMPPQKRHGRRITRADFSGIWKIGIGRFCRGPRTISARRNAEMSPDAQPDRLQIRRLIVADGEIRRLRGIVLLHDLAAGSCRLPRGPTRGRPRAQASRHSSMRASRRQERAAEVPR